MPRARRAVAVAVGVAMALGLTAAGLAALTVAVVIDATPALAAEVLAQDAPAGQEVADDGTRPLRLLAVLMGLLALLLGAFTRWYWKATVPPARRGYLPDSDGTPIR